MLVTQRYAHLRPDLFGEKAFDAIPVDISQPAGVIASIFPRPAPSTEDSAISVTAPEDQLRSTAVTSHGLVAI